MLVNTMQSTKIFIESLVVLISTIQTIIVYLGTAFISLTSTKFVTKTKIVMVPPLIGAPPSDYNILYIGLMTIQNISERVNGKEELTVVTLDMELYVIVV